MSLQEKGRLDTDMNMPGESEDAVALQAKGRRELPVMTGSQKYGPCPSGLKEGDDCSYSGLELGLQISAALRTHL